MASTKRSQPGHVTTQSVKNILVDQLGHVLEDIEQNSGHLFPGLKLKSNGRPEEDRCFNVVL